MPSIPGHQLEKLRYYQRRAAKQGSIHYHLATPETCGGLLEELFRLHNARWSARGGGMFCDPKVRQFHRDVAAEFAESNLLRLHQLSIDAEPAAVLYALSNARETYFYLAGFKPKFEKLSPGTLIIGQAIQRAFAEHHSAFDFLRGKEPYKYSWGARDCPTRAIRFQKR
jgi:CelD/BcsL family acetyltransferase involved in cellulose biosynthesis